MSGKADVVVRNGLLVSGEEIAQADIIIADGVIREVGRHKGANSAERVIDASGAYVLPGIIDVHAHFHVELPYVDDLHALSRTAAFGGTTTILPFLFVQRGKELVATLKQAIDEGRKHSLLDFGFHLCMFDTQAQLEQIPESAGLGVPSFKMLMTYSKLGYMAADDALLAAMELIAQIGGLAMVHAENGVVIDYLQDKFVAEGKIGPEYFALSQPVVLETEAINRAIALASMPGCALYIPHISTGTALEPIVRARREGQEVYAETCPKYLTLTNKAVLERGILAKVGPPLREDADRESLWQALASGVIDVVASDHVPKDKERTDNIFEAPFGAPGAETMLTVMYDEAVNRGKATACRLVQLLCENPAKIFGLYPQKGALQAGSDADLVVFDPRAKRTITHRTQHTNTKYTLYEGRECLGSPVLSMQRGTTVLERGELRTVPGQAKYLHRSTLQGRGQPND
jgi:dihydropyrimidinase